MSTERSDPHDVARVLEERFGRAKTERSELESAIEAARRTEEVWHRLRDAHNGSRPAEVVAIFRQNSVLFADLRASGDPAVSTLETLYKECEQAAKEAARRFSSLFPAACKHQDIELDSSSRDPRYSVAEFIQITVNDRNLEATIAPRDGQAQIVPLDVDAVVARLKSEVDRLFKHERDPKRLLAGLRKAYQAVLRDEKRKPGEEIPLRRVANRLSKNWGQFRYDEFNVDLARIVRDGFTVIDNERLHLNHTRDTRQGILLHELESSGYVGFISFKPEGSDA